MMMQDMAKKKILVPLMALLLISGILYFLVNSSNARSNPPSFAQPVFNLKIDTSIASSVFLDYDYIQFFHRGDLDHFYKSWKNTKNKKLSIVHLGDSHLQSDIYPARIRRNFQNIHGDGGRGLIFPYSAAKTYSSIEYKTTHTGDWTYGKEIGRA